MKHNRRQHPSIALCLLLLLLVLQMPPSPRAQDVIETIPANITDIRLLGSWELDGKSGLYRGIVSVKQPGKTNFVVQWIEFDEIGALSKVEHSMPIPEIAKLGGILVDYRGEIDAQGLTVFLDLQSTSDAPPETYVLYVNGPDDYTFESASN